MWWNGKLWRKRGMFPGTVLCLVLAGVPVFAQQLPSNPRFPIPPPPPPDTTTAIPETSPTQTPQPAVPPVHVVVPERVMLPAGSVLSVVLETPLSTRIAKKDQRVTFRTTSPVHVAEGLEIPPDTAIQGTVLEAKKPGGFGKAGVIRVKVNQVELTQNVPTPLVGRLQSAETDKQGRIHADHASGTDLIQVAQYTLMGTLMGARIGGGKGAGIGAGAGVLAALLIMMSKRGQDVYLEPGMPFVVVLDQPLELPGQEVLAAQESYAQAHPTASGGPTGNGSPADPSMTIPPNERPVLKRRPKKP